MNEFINNFWLNNINIFKHFFIATNDYDEDIYYLQSKLNSINNNNINNFISVSGGWFFLLANIPSYNIIENIVLYDINPNMLYIYNLIYHLFIISPNINSFIINLFCRSLDDYKYIKTNEDVINYMNKKYDKNIYNKTKKQLKKYGLNGQLASMIYKLLIKKYILNIDNNHKHTNTIPTYNYDKNNYKIFNKKLHTTQKFNDSSHFLTTFYLNKLEPFLTNEKYIITRNHLLISNVSFKLFDLNTLSINTIDNLLKFNKTINNNTLLYIDGIDIDYFNYLSMNRSNLFKIIQNIIINKKLNKFFIFSTKSGLSIIDKNNILYDEYYIKTKNIEIIDKPLDKNYNSFNYTNYDKDYILRLNNDLSNNLIKTFRYSQYYKLFKKMPKPGNPHIHFSAIISYKYILKIINKLKNYPDIYINFNNNNIKIGFENEEINKNNSILYDKNIHYNKIIKILNHNHIINNKFNLINNIGDMFYNIIKYKKFYDEIYIPLIIKYMDKHNIYYMDIRLILGTVFNIVNNKRIYLSYNEELDILYKHKNNRFKYILSISKCKNYNYIINNITNICDIIYNNKFNDIITGFDLVGDENNCNEIKYLINELNKIKLKYKINYFIHAGEFINSSKSLNNLINVYDLKPTRIGHAIYYITNNKDNLEYNNKILLEICPISNYFFHHSIYNYHKFIKNIDYIIIGSDDDNKQNSNLSIDYMFFIQFFNRTKTRRFVV